MEDPRKEKVHPMRLFDVDVSYTIIKKASVTTYDYELLEEEGEVHVETAHTDWEEAYREDHYTIDELLKKLREFAKNELSHLPSQSARAIELKHIMNNCDDWHVVEQHYEEG